MRGVVVGMLCGLVAAIGATAGGAGPIPRTSERLHHVAVPAKVARLDFGLGHTTGSSKSRSWPVGPAPARNLVSRTGGRVQDAYRGVIEAQVPATSLAALARSSAVSVVRRRRARSPTQYPDRESRPRARQPGTAPESTARASRSPSSTSGSAVTAGARAPATSRDRRSRSTSAARRLRGDEPRNRRRRDRVRDGARREALSRVHQGRRRARPGRRLRARPRHPDHQPLRRAGSTRAAVTASARPTRPRGSSPPLGPPGSSG